VLTSNQEFSFNVACALISGICKQQSSGLRGWPRAWLCSWEDPSQTPAGPRVIWTVCSTSCPLVFSSVRWEYLWGSPTGLYEDEIITVYKALRPGLCYVVGIIVVSVAWWSHLSEPRASWGLFQTWQTNRPQANSLLNEGLQSSCGNSQVGLMSAAEDTPLL
jgi:hypothetical protein